MNSNLGRFVGSADSLAPAGWEKPDYILAAIRKKKLRRRAAQRIAVLRAGRRAWCPTGPGGGKDNSCSPNGGSVGNADVPAASELTKVKTLGGSTGAVLAKDKNGRQWVIKKGNSAAHVRAEAQTNSIYAAAGVPVPAHRLDEMDGKAVQVTEFIPGKTLDQVHGAAREKAIEQLREHFAVDALVANWDVIGLNEDNILVPSDGRPALRIDNGGSLTFRAQGAPKNFDGKVWEIDSLRTSQQGKPIFGSLTNQDVAAQIDKLGERRADILKATPPELRDVMRERLDYMKKWAAANRKEDQRSEDRAWCATGPGGGKDNSCSPNGGAGGADSGGGTKSGKQPGDWMKKKGYPDASLIKSIGHAKLYSILVAQKKQQGLSTSQAKQAAKAMMKTANIADPGSPNAYAALCKQYGIDPNHPDNTGDPATLKNDPGIYAAEKAAAMGLLKPPTAQPDPKTPAQDKAFPPPAPPAAPPPPPPPPPATPDPKAPAVQAAPNKAAASKTPGFPPPGMLPVNSPDHWKSHTHDSVPSITSQQKAVLAALPIAKEAIQKYTGSDYTHLNETLRKNTTNTGGSFHQLESLGTKTALLVASLDAATRAETHPKEFDVYRGSGHTVAKMLDSIGVGDVWQDPGFMSTSTRRDMAETWGEGSKEKPGVAMKITTKYGMNVKAISTHGSENEHLLPRRSQFRLKTKEWRYISGKPRLYVELEHIGWHP